MNFFWKRKHLFTQKIENFLTRSYGDEFSCYLLDILGLVFYQAAVPLHFCALVLCYFRRYLTVFTPAPPVNPQTISVMLTNFKRACFIMINIKKTLVKMYAFRLIQYFDKNRLRNSATTMCHTRNKNIIFHKCENIHHNINLKTKTKSMKLN